MRGENIQRSGDGGYRPVVVQGGERRGLGAGIPKLPIQLLLSLLTSTIIIGYSKYNCATNLSALLNLTYLIPHT